VQFLCMKWAIVLLVVVAFAEVPNSGWTRMADMPMAMAGVAGAGLNGFIYSTGGRDANNTVTPLVYAYDTSAGKWSQRANLLHARELHAATNLNGFIYVFGGISDVAIENKAEKYDPEKDQWSLITIMNFGRALPAAAGGSDGLLYCLGGCIGTNCQPSKDVQIYYPQYNLWNEGPSLHYARAGAQAATIGDNIYVFGGDDGNGALEAYNTKTLKWLILAYQVSGTVGGGGAAVFGLIYSLGGVASVNGMVQVYDPSQNIWSNATTLRFPPYLGWSAFGAAVGTDNKAYVFGGLNATTPFVPCVGALTITQVSEVTASK